MSLVRRLALVFAAVLVGAAFLGGGVRATVMQPSGETMPVKAGREASAAGMAEYSAALDALAPAPSAAAKAAVRKDQDLNFDIFFSHAGRRLSWRRNGRRGYVLAGSANRIRAKGSGEASKAADAASNRNGSDEAIQFARRNVQVSGDQ